MHYLNIVLKHLNKLEYLYYLRLLTPNAAKKVKIELNKIQRDLSLHYY